MGRKKKQQLPPVQEQGADDQLPEPFPMELLHQSKSARQAHFEQCLIEHAHLQHACDAVVRAICMPGETPAYRRLDSMVLVIGESASRQDDPHPLAGRATSLPCTSTDAS
jgi:hypothetical protein